MFSLAGLGAWLYHSRADDVLHLSDVQVFDPFSIAWEEKIRKHPGPSAILVESSQWPGQAADRNFRFRLAAAHSVYFEVAWMDTSRVIFVHKVVQWAAMRWYAQGLRFVAALK